MHVHALSVAHYPPTQEHPHHILTACYMSAFKLLRVPTADDRRYSAAGKGVADTVFLGLTLSDAAIH